MQRQQILFSCFIAVLFCVPGFSLAQDNPLPTENVFDERFEIWPVDLTIRGNILLGSASDKSVQEQIAAVAEAGREILSAVDGVDDEENDLPTLVTIAFEEPGDVPELPQNVSLFVWNADIDIEELNSSIGDATQVILCHQGEFVDENVIAALHGLEEQFRGLIDRRGTLLARGTLARLMGSGPDGLNLVPDSLIIPEFDAETHTEQMLSQLSAMPRTVGIGIPAGGMVELSGRKFRGQATFLLPECDHLPQRVETLVPATRENRNPYETTVDLTAWRRDAIERSLEQYPPVEREVPYVANGTLIIVGGGGMPSGSDELFLSLAGGDDARLVYVPCAEEESLRRPPRILRSWQAAGAASADWIHTKDRNLANGDEEFLEPLQNATGLFFGGGRQWNFADSYYGTEAHRLMKQVLDRGGVVCGSSAGASIQGGYLARANPVANFDIMAPGYERGLGFLRGVAIDQHFTQRRRQPDLESLVVRYPQLLGIGIDESTALVVQESEGRVIGAGKVWFYDQPVGQEEPCEPVALPAGSRYDLANRTVISQPDEDE
ncbi:MAG: cyanophycinase [Planctomycetota bacterium]